MGGAPGCPRATSNSGAPPQLFSWVDLSAKELTFVAADSERNPPISSHWPFGQVLEEKVPVPFPDCLVSLPRPTVRVGSSLYNHHELSVRPPSSATEFLAARGTSRFSPSAGRRKLAAARTPRMVALGFGFLCHATFGNSSRAFLLPFFLPTPAALLRNSFRSGPLGRHEPPTAVQWLGGLPAVDLSPHAPATHGSKHRPAPESTSS